MLMGEQPTETSPPKLLPSQQTGDALHSPADRPTAESGEQFIPILVVRSSTAMPKRSSMPDMLFAGCTELQHWIGPVLHCAGAFVGVGLAVVATLDGAGLCAGGGGGGGDFWYGLLLEGGVFWCGLLFDGGFPYGRAVASAKNATKKKSLKIIAD